MAGLCLIKLVITEGFMAVTCERSQVGAARDSCPAWALDAKWVWGWVGNGM